MSVPEMAMEDEIPPAFDTGKGVQHHSQRKTHYSLYNHYLIIV